MMGRPAHGERERERESERERERERDRDGESESDSPWPRTGEKGRRQGGTGEKKTERDPQRNVLG